MKIPFEKEYRNQYYELLEQIFDSNVWSEGVMLRTFEKKFSDYTGLGARGIANGGAGLLAILEYIDVRDKEVIVPANTFWATPRSVYKAGGQVVYADCNRDDLCLSYDDMITRVTPRTAAVIVVHIGGHIAFEIEKIAAYCEEHNIYLIEDCAHVHGGWWHGKTGGHWGIAGSYSFYATKTLPLGDGGMVVSKDRALLEWIEHFRNYGKHVVDGCVTYPVPSGFNYRLSEFNAALGVVQMDRLPLILEWKTRLAEKFDQVFTGRVRFPEGMQSGYYKYIVFDYSLTQEAGQVFGPGDLGYRIENRDINLPNSEWVTGHHACVPIFYGWEHADASAGELEKLLLNI